MRVALFVILSYDVMWTAKTTGFMLLFFFLNCESFTEICLCEWTSGRRHPSDVINSSEQWESRDELWVAPVFNKSQCSDKATQDSKELTIKERLSEPIAICKPCFLSWAQIPLVWQFFLNKSSFTKNISLIVLLNFADKILTVLDDKRLKVNISTFKGVRKALKAISRYELSKNSRAGSWDFPHAAIIIAESNCTWRFLV